MIAVFESERQKQMDSINLWNLPELSKYIKLFQKVTHEGIYSFGGATEVSYPTPRTM